MIDARIALGIQQPQFENPLAKLAQIAQIQGYQNQNRLADLKFQEAERDIANERSTNELYRLAVGEDGQLDRNKLFSLAGQRGMGSKIPAWQKQFSDADKATAEVGKTKAETTKISQDAVTKALDNNRQTLTYVSDPQTAAQWVAAGFSDPVIGPIFSRSGTLEQAIARIPQDPQGFADWKRQNGLGIEKYIEMSKPNVQIRNTGGTTDTLAINPWTGAGQVTGSVKNTQSPDSVASVAATIRGQNMTDARGREANTLKRQEIEAGGKAPAGYRWKPDGTLEAIAGGPATKDQGGTEGERNAAGYADRMTAAEKLIGQVGTKDPKAQKPGMIEQATGGVGMIANASRSETRQQYRQAQEDWVRAKLRKESGAAIPNDEMEREISVYFPQIGDKPDVIRQKADARKVAEEAMRKAGGKAMTPRAEGGVIDFGSLK